MDKRNVVDWSLKIIINMSAFLCAIKSKHKIIHIILECLYSMIILFFSVTFISFFIATISENETVDIGNIVRIIGLTFLGCLFYLIISNLRSKEKIEDYILLGALYIEEYLKHKERKKMQKWKFILEFLNFCCLYIFLLYCTTSLLEILCKVSEYTNLICSIGALFITYNLFIYGKRDEDVQKFRKAYSIIIITVVWLFIVFMRLNHYISNKPQFGFEDMTLLLFSVIFTIPSIYECLKDISSKFVKPYTETVKIRKEELINTYMIVKEEGKEYCNQVFGELKKIGLIVKKSWKTIENKKIKKLVAMLILAIILMFLAYLSESFISRIMEELGDWIKIWYASLNHEVQKFIKKSITVIFIVGLMLYGLLKSSGTVKDKKTYLNKGKYIIELIVFECMFGYSIYIIVIS